MVSFLHLLQPLIDTYLVMLILQAQDLLATQKGVDELELSDAEKLAAFEQYKKDLQEEEEEEANEKRRREEDAERMRSPKHQDGDVSDTDGPDESGRSRKDSSRRSSRSDRHRSRRSESKRHRSRSYSRSRSPPSEKRKRDDEEEKRPLSESSTLPEPDAKRPKLATSSSEADVEEGEVLPDEQ